jgi:hypothetical protein
VREIDVHSGATEATLGVRSTDQYLPKSALGRRLRSSTQDEKWFWDTLVNADAANNPASWQWVAGSGVRCSLSQSNCREITLEEAKQRFATAYLPPVASAQ